MKVVVIGEGFGGKIVAPVYRQLGFETEVVSPRDAEAVRRACANSVDLVSVHSPPFKHLENVMCALDHGRAVLCDKPFGRSAAEARAMRDRARQLGVLTFLNFEFRRQPSRIKLKQLLDDGAIGTLHHVSWTYIGSGLRPQKYRWLFDASQSGGWINAFGSHAIDTMRWLAESEVVDCGGVCRIETRTRPDKDGVAHVATAEDAYSSWYVMANGATVSYDTALSAAVTLPGRIILMGSEGSLELVSEVTIILRRPGQQDETIEFPRPQGDLRLPSLVPWLTEIRDALQQGRPLTPSFDDGLAVAETMDRLRAKLVRAERK